MKSTETLVDQIWNIPDYPSTAKIACKVCKRTSDNGVDPENMNSLAISSSAEIELLSLSPVLSRF